MRLVYFIRHASPAIQPAVPPEEWVLSPRGVDEARALARIAAGWDLKAIYSSREPKTMSTALILAEDTDLQVHTVEGLHETRLAGGYMSNADEFSEMVRAVFEQPEVSVRGSETAAAAAARFAGAIAIVEEGPFPAAVVTHGRVLISYLTCERGFGDPFALWRSIPIPGWACLDLDAPAATLVSGFDGLPDS
jgi:broad specificity phosphatase PhoE